MFDTSIRRMFDFFLLKRKDFVKWVEKYRKKGFLKSKKDVNLRYICHTKKMGFEGPRFRLS